jgi:CheY-like chemotaxis protein
VTILIIDDEPDIRLIVRLSLERRGLTVVEASGGQEGVALARRAPPDAILLDVMMPKVDGPTTLAELRAAPESASIPVVFLTAKAQRSELERLRNLGAAGVLTKPFDPMTLADEVLAMLGRET